MKPILLTLYDAEHHADRLVARDICKRGDLETRRFPDGESYVRVVSDVSGRDVVVLAALHRPDDKLLPLVFLLDLLRDLEARSVGLAVPYLPYMRQDARFKPGEAISSRSFAHLISDRCDWMVTLAPHLHRRGDLASVYEIPTEIAAMEKPVAAWIDETVDAPLLVGPDEESSQWVEPVAAELGCPYVIFDKVRSGDRDVAVDSSSVDAERWRSRTPVIIDDIISSGVTMAETIRGMIAEQFPAPVCLGIHPVFSEKTLRLLTAAGARAVASCNTIVHASNAIDVSDAIADAVAQMLDTGR